MRRYSSSVQRFPGSANPARPVSDATATAPVPLRIEVTVASGLEDVALKEVRASPEGDVVSAVSPESGVLFLEYRGSLERLLKLKTAQAAFICVVFDVPRPRGLLGDENLRRIFRMISSVRELSGADAYRTLALGAAGAETAVMTRLRDTLASWAGLKAAMDDGDLQIRVRRPRHRAAGWEVLVRIGPRPLAVRSWRASSFPGALNGAVAHAMALLTGPRPSDLFLNLCCGSGTLLIERLSCGPAAGVIGCDIDSAALQCACANTAAAGARGRVQLIKADVRAVPLRDASVDAICADLPFGHRVGSHRENRVLYPAVADEVARVARPGAVFAALTAEPRLFEHALGAGKWNSILSRKRTIGEVRPHLFVLRRTGSEF